jgi:hypothetical protein
VCQFDQQQQQLLARSLRVAPSPFPGSSLRILLLLVRSADERRERIRDQHEIPCCDPVVLGGEKEETVSVTSADKR